MAPSGSGASKTSDEQRTGYRSVPSQHTEGNLDAQMISKLNEFGAGLREIRGELLSELPAWRAARNAIG